MKKSMPEYMNALSADNYDILEEIFTSKYKKFIELYWLIKEFSDYISSLKYKNTDKKDILKIELTLANIDLDYVFSELENSIKERDNILITNEGKLIRIEITKEENM